MPQNKMPKMPENFVCNNCDFVCCKKSNWNKHLLTPKHKNLQNPTPPYKTYNCNCGKIYKHSSTYYAHKKKCKYLECLDIVDHNCQNNVMNVMLEVVKQNDEFKTLLLDQNNKMLETFQEVCKNGITNNSNNSAVNSHNKTFNIWFDFLLL